jgi:hypothetical protein
MKRNFLILFMMFFALSVCAQQSNKQDVISSAGGFNVVSGMSISWTLGETIIPTFKSQDGTLILTHGFQQQLVITAVEENILNPVQVTIYPNPTSEIINIEFNTPNDGEISLFMFDGQGKPVKTDQIGFSVTNKQINMQDLPPGIYYLRLTKGKHVNVYKVVKL